jgi:hypothetical protein
MDVSVVEAREDETATGVDDRRSRAGQRSNLLV